MSLEPFPEQLGKGNSATKSGGARLFSSNEGSTKKWGLLKSWAMEHGERRDRQHRRLIEIRRAWDPMGQVDVVWKWRVQAWGLSLRRWGTPGSVAWSLLSPCQESVCWRPVPSGGGWQAACNSVPRPSSQKNPSESARASQQVAPRHHPSWGRGSALQPMGLEGGAGRNKREKETCDEEGRSRRRRLPQQGPPPALRGRASTVLTVPTAAPRARRPAGSAAPCRPASGRAAGRGQARPHRSGRILRRRARCRGQTSGF